MRTRSILVKLGLGAAILIAAACNRGDQIAPDGATIDLAATPTTIPLIGGSGTANIVATVRSPAGLPLPDQDVRFSTTAGTLSTVGGEDAANVPIRTDDLGNAHVILVTTKTTTVTARSGKATGTLTLDTVPGDLSTIVLNVDSTSPGCLPDTTFTSCNQSLCLEAQALDTAGDPIVGVVIVFKLQNNVNTDGDPFTGVFNPTQTTTGGVGVVARTQFSLGSACPDQCSGGKSCTGEIVATTQGGGFPSTPQTFDTAIP